MEGRSTNCLGNSELKEVRIGSIRDIFLGRLLSDGATNKVNLDTSYFSYSTLCDPVLNNTESQQVEESHGNRLRTFSLSCGRIGKWSD
jgi:hypothetical protein